MIKIPCKVCSKVIVKKWLCQFKNPKTATCSKLCMGKFNSKHRVGKKAINWQGGDIDKKCKICSKPMSFSKSTVKKRITCSRKCHGIWRSRTFVGSKHPMWNGGRIIGTRGYVMLLAKWHPKANTKGYYSEHRIVMEKHLGRLLDKTEVVHHKNHNRADNRLCNLEHFSSHSEHMQSEHKNH